MSTTTPTTRSTSTSSSSSSSSSSSTTSTNTGTVTSIANTPSTLTRTESEPVKYSEDMDVIDGEDGGRRKHLRLKPLKGLLKKSASEGSEKKMKRVKFSETMMVFCDDWPEELMPQIIALKSPTDFNLIEVATQGYMYEPPAEYQDLLPFDPPPDYRDCSGHNSGLPGSISAYDNDESINYIDEDVPDSCGAHHFQHQEIRLEGVVDGQDSEDESKYGSNLNWENMILNESELLEEDAIIGVLKEDDILQAIGSQAADVDTVFHATSNLSDYESLECENQEEYLQDSMSRSNDSESHQTDNSNYSSQNHVNNNNNLSVNFCVDRNSLASEASETYSEAEELSSSPTESLQDIASDSSFTSQDTIILMTNAIIKENNRRQAADCQNSTLNSEIGLSYSSVKQSESVETDGHIDSEAESTDTVLEVRNDFESDFETVEENDGQCSIPENETRKQKKTGITSEEVRGSRNEDVHRHREVKEGSGDEKGDVSERKVINSAPAQATAATALDPSSEEDNEMETNKGLESETITSTSSSSTLPQQSVEFLQKQGNTVTSTTVGATVTGTTMVTISSSISVSEIRKAFEKHLSVESGNSSSSGSSGSQQTARPKSFPCSSQSKETIKSLEALQLSTTDPLWKGATVVATVGKDMHEKTGGVTSSCNVNLDLSAASSKGIAKDLPKEDLIIEYTSEPRALVPSKRTSSFTAFSNPQLNPAIYRPALIVGPDISLRSPNNINVGVHSPQFVAKGPPPPYDHQPQKYFQQQHQHPVTPPVPHPRSVSLRPQQSQENSQTSGINQHQQQEQAHHQNEIQNQCIPNSDNKNPSEYPQHTQQQQQQQMHYPQHHQQVQLMVQRALNQSPHPQPNQQQDPQTQQILLRPRPPLRTTSQSSPVPQRHGVPVAQVQQAHVRPPYPPQYSSQTLPLPHRQVILIPQQHFQQIRQQIQQQKASQSSPHPPNSPQRCSSVPPRSPIPYIAASVHPQSRIYQQLPLQANPQLAKNTEFPDPSEIRRRDGLNAYPHVWEEPPKPGELPVPPVEPSKLNPGTNTKDELELFVQQDKERTERIKKRYSLAEEDDPTFGFGKRPSVKGVKTKLVDNEWRKGQPDAPGQRQSLPPSLQQQYQQQLQQQMQQQQQHPHHQAQQFVGQPQILLHIHHPNPNHQHQHLSHDQNQPRHVYLIPHQSGPQYQQRLVQVGATLPRVTQQQILQLRQNQNVQQVRLRQKVQQPQSGEQTAQMPQQQQSQHHHQQQQQHMLHHQQQLHLHHLQQPQQSQGNLAVHQTLQRPSSSLGQAQLRTIRGQDGLLLQVYESQHVMVPPKSPGAGAHLPSLLQYKTASMPNVAMIKNAAQQLTIIPIRDERGTPEGASSSPKHSSDTGYSASPSNSKASTSNASTTSGTPIISSSVANNNNPDLVKDATRATSSASCSSASSCSTNKSSVSSQGPETNPASNSGTKNMVKTLSGKEGVIYYSMNV